MAATWLVRFAGLDAPWVGSAGEAHHQRFTTHAHGRLRRDGRPAIGFGISHSDHQHPTPWHWDLVLLLASVDLSRRVTATAMESLATTVTAEYLRTLTRIAEDDGEAALRIDLNGLPEAIKRAIIRESAPEAFDAHLARHCSGPPGRLRLLPAQRQGHDRATNDLMAALLAAALDRETHAGGAPLDLVRQRRRDPLRLAGPGWLALVHEQDRTGAWRPRLVEIRERQCNAFARLLPTTPFPPHAMPPPRRSDDPFRTQIAAAGHVYEVSTFSHACRSPSLARIDAGDLIRLAQVWGQVLAGCHSDGLSSLGLPVGAQVGRICDDARRRIGVLPGLAQGLARSTRQAHAAWRRLGLLSARTRQG
jgi:hypothetical protein